MSRNNAPDPDQELNEELNEFNIEPDLLDKIRKSGKGSMDLPNGDILVTYRDANRRSLVVVYSGQDGRTLAVGMQ